MWTNPSPAAEFGQQTVQLDLTKYTAVLVKFYEYPPVDSRKMFATGIAFVGEQNATAVIVPYTANDVLTSFSARNFVVQNTSGVTFLVAVNSSGINNKQCVPYQIYGIH